MNCEFASLEKDPLDYLLRIPVSVISSGVPALTDVTLLVERTRALPLLEVGKKLVITT